MAHSSSFINPLFNPSASTASSAEYSVAGLNIIDHDDDTFYTSGAVRNGCDDDDGGDHGAGDVDEEYPSVSRKVMVDDDTVGGSSIGGSSTEIRRVVVEAAAREEEDLRRLKRLREAFRDEERREKVERERIEEGLRRGREEEMRRKVAKEREVLLEREEGRRDIEEWRKGFFDALLLKDGKVGVAAQVDGEDAEREDAADGFEEKDDVKPAAVIEDEKVAVGLVPEVSKEEKERMKRKKKKEKEKEKNRLKKEQLQKQALLQAEEEERKRTLEASRLKCTACGTGVVNAKEGFWRDDKIYCCVRCSKVGS
jgi:hypothetical protein